MNWPDGNMFYAIRNVTSFKDHVKRRTHLMMRKGKLPLKSQHERPSGEN